MSSERLELIGGPLDGDTILKQRGKYAWVSARMLRFRQPFTALPKIRLEARSASGEPASGRALYEQAAGGCLYAGHRRTLCAECGSYHPKVEGGSEKLVCPLAKRGLA